ncbi:DUF2797 domain-containing protein [Streptomyces sp. NPDC057521]|uniref:DUF2797 domain-containing protein n=1 Tax=Streptomyces sp. NPDC057521 TaxID=3346156 RepID=UPI003686685D
MTTHSPAGESMSPLAVSDSEYVSHGVTWAAGRPQLQLAPVAPGALAFVDIMGHRLGLRITSAERFCTGRYRFVSTYQVKPEPCPRRLPTTQGDQCDWCRQGDDFRFAHQFHRGGHTPAALADYMSQPHWLYIATFANQASKVGTAADPRKRSRLDEQGALFATYLAKSVDGRTIRQLEDSITRHLGIGQSVRGAAKVAALTNPSGLRAAQNAHEGAVRSAVAFLKGLEITPVLEAWPMPDEGHGLRTTVGSGERVLYPFSLREGEHGFTVESCIGSQVLARPDRPDNGVSYVLDLAALKGCRLVLGSYSSPNVVIQTALF